MSWSTLPTHMIHSLLIVSLSALGLVLVCLLSRRALSCAASLKRVREARRRQLVTLVHALRWVANVVILGIALMMVLGSFGVNITPLVTSAGVAGLTISLGAQSLIKDFIGGVLVLAENQYAVGDTIQIGTVSGQVEEITLRTTHVRALDGSLYIVPNGEVRIVANQTRN
jgi:small-conductance mechanosensitive channel